MDRYFIKRCDERRRYLICDKVSHTGFVYQSGHAIGEIYDLDTAEFITQAINKEERRRRHDYVENSKKRSEREGQI